MKQFSPDQPRLADAPARPAPERRSRESNADRRAIDALDSGRPQGAATASLHALPDWQGQHNPLPDSGGQEIAAPLRAPFEQGFKHDFSRVRIFATGATANAVRSAGSRATTCGPRIAFAPGQWAPETHSGRALLAHELAHVTQQAGEGIASLDHKTLDEEIDEELKAKTADPKSLDPTNPEYARSLQDYGYDITHDKSGKVPVLLKEPTDPKAKEAWKRRFQKIDKLAGRILDQSGPKVEQKEIRAELMAADLASAGFVNEAMALAPKITDPDLRKFVHQAVLEQPAKVTEAQITTIAQDQASNAKSMADHELFTSLTTDQGVYANKLGSTKVNAALKVIVKAYASDPKLPEKLAQLMFFHPGSRATFTEWMMTDKRGALLKQVSEQSYFVEGANIQAGSATLHPDPATLGWAIGNRQRVTVEDVIALCAAAGTPLTAPAARDTATLRAWLELNTEKIGQAVNKQNPGKPEAAEAMYTQIVDAFTWHVPADSKEDVKPDKSGHITKLSAAGPKNSQLKVDCDVLATYGVRLLVASGYTAIGYMAVKPTDPDRAPHALALLQHGKDFHAISNNATSKLAATSKAGALKEMRDFGLDEAYDASRPLTGYGIYYMDCDAKGTLPDEVLNQDSKARDGGLSK
jgi:hypothetical protein